MRTFARFLDTRSRCKIQRNSFASNNQKFAEKNLKKRRESMLTYERFISVKK